MIFMLNGFVISFMFVDCLSALIIVNVFVCVFFYIFVFKLSLSQATCNNVCVCAVDDGLLLNV